MNLTNDQRAEMKSWLSAVLRSICDEPVNADEELHLEVDEDIRIALDLTLRQILQTFGSNRSFIDWIKQIKEIEAIHLKRLDAAKKEGKLVSRDKVSRGIIEPFEAAHVRLMTDASRKIADRCIMMCKAGKTRPEIQNFVSKEIGTHIRTAKSKIRRNLKFL